MSDKEKIKALLQSGDRNNQIIAIQLMTNLGWLLDDCALFCFLNIKPLRFLLDSEKTYMRWQYKVGNYDIRFNIEHKYSNYWMRSDIAPIKTIKEKEYNYNCNLSHYRNPSNLILKDLYPMELNPPVLEYFGAAVLLNLE